MVHFITPYYLISGHYPPKSHNLAKCTSYNISSSLEKCYFVSIYHLPPLPFFFFFCAWAGFCCLGPAAAGADAWEDVAEVETEGVDDDEVGRGEDGPLLPLPPGDGLLASLLNNTTIIVACYGVRKQ